MPRPDARRRTARPYPPNRRPDPNRSRSRSGRRDDQYPYGGYPYQAPNRRRGGRRDAYGGGPYPFAGPYGYGGHVDRDGGVHRTAGSLHRAQAARNARRAYMTAAFTANTVKGAVRHRRRLAALYAVTTLATLAPIVHTIPDGMVAAGVVGAAPAAWAGIRNRSARRAAARRGEAAPKPTASQYAGWAARIGTALWLPATAATGLNGPLALSLAAGGATGVTWWAIHTRPQREVEAEVFESVGDEGPGPIEAIWNAYVGNIGGALPGSLLADVTEDDEGWHAVVQVARGRQDNDSVRAASGRIASAYGVNGTAVNVTDVPGGAKDQALIAVYVDNPLTEVQEFTRPSLDPETGWMNAGNAPDGSTARWRLFEPKSGPCGGLIFGAQGTGKSGFVNTLCAEIAHSGLAVLWVGDGQDGLSLPEWSEHGADWFAGGIPETRRMLQAAERVMRGRQRRRRSVRWVDEDGIERRGLGFFNPTPECPALYVVIDEWPLIAKDDECRRIVALLLKAGRKVGITAVVIGQIPSIAEFGGDSDAAVVRSLASTTNIAMFRIAKADRTSQHMGGMGMDGVDASDIPAAFADGTGTQGLGYLRAPGGSTVHMRGLYTPKPILFATTAPGTLLEPDARADAGRDYDTWRQRRDEELDNEDDDVRDEVPATGPRDARGEPADAPPALRGAGPLAALPHHAAASLRNAALTVLRGTGQVLSTNQLTTHVRALLGSEDVNLNAVTAALKRAKADGEVLQYPPLAGTDDRSARWQAAPDTPNPKARDRARDD